MLFFLLACTAQSPDARPPEKPPPTPPAQNISPPDERAPKPHPTDTNINSSAQTLTHPRIPQKRVAVDVCAPYYRLLSLEAQRGTSTADEEERIKSLRALNHTLEYHPENTAQAIVELEKETFHGPVHLSIDDRKKHWHALHSYIGSICRVDRSHMKK